ncbi:2-oxoglutarate dehydrogenase, E2 component, dihydrolipoamide succinyltransferase, partial [Agrococcus lahaulensis]
MTDIQLPALGESVTEGTITRWLKAVGDEVAVDEPIVEVSTDKVDTEVPSPVAGTITEILADEDDTVEVGAVIARVGDAGDAPAEQAPAEEAPAEEAPAEEPAAETATEGTDPEADQEADEESAAEAQESPSQEAEQAEEAPQEAPAAEAKPAAGGGTDITLPALGESVTEGTITRWLKAVGDEVAVDEPIVEVSTDKVDTEVPSPVAGTITELLADEDDTVDVGAVIARVGGAAAAPADEPKTDEPPADADGSAQAQDAAPAPQAEPAEPSTEQPEPAKAPEAEAPKAEEPKAEPKAEEPKAAPAQPAAPKAPAAPAPAAPAPAAPAAAAPAAPAPAAP